MVVTDQSSSETPTTDSGEEGLASSSALPAHTAPSADAGGAQASVVHADVSSEGALESAAVVATGPPTQPPSAPTANHVEVQAALGVSDGDGGGPHAALTESGSAGALSCELSALGGQTSDNCTVGWLGGKRFLRSSAVDLAPSVSSLVAAAGAGVPPSGGGHGGSAVGNSPAPPAPGPSPSGASGAAVGGSSGLAPSAFLTLAGLLLLAGPRAMRRLRLSCRPWRTACFALIPERPG